MQDQKETNKKAGFVAIIGAPNAGKSTMMNAMIGADVSIVTHKVQTTRAPVRGIVVHHDSQIVFVDTPGIFDAKGTLNTALVQTAEARAKDSDVLLVVIDAVRGLQEDIEKILEFVKGCHKPTLVVLNKVDLISKDKLLPLASSLSARGFPDIYYVSALKELYLTDVLDEISKNLPMSPWFFDAETVTDMPYSLMAAEVTRKTLLTHVHKEIPYHLTVETEHMETKKDGSVRIDQVIWVKRDSQRMIVLGKNGESIKRIGSIARQEMSELFDVKVHLFLHVKVNKSWDTKESYYRYWDLTS